VSEVREWGGTTLSKLLERKIRTASPPVTLEQEVRLRLLARRSN
jgi:hypothetical protein